MYLCKIKNGNYYVYYRGANGKRTKKSCGTKYKSEALKFLTDFQKIYEDKLLNQNTKTLKEFIFEYLKNISVNNTSKSYETYKTTFNFFTNYISPQTLLKDITTEQLENYLNKRAAESSLYQRRKDYINLKAFFNKAVGLNYIKKNPLSSIKPTKLPTKVPKYFSEDELKELLKVVDNQDFKDLILFAFNSGMRQGELINLEWKNVNLDQKYVLVTNTETFTTKSKRSRQIPLNDTTYNILLRRNSNSNNSLVFTEENSKFEKYRLIKKFKKWVKESNINTSLSFHSLRHGFASHLVKNNVSIYTVSKLLGHQDISTTTIYSHLSTNEFSNAVNLF